MSRAEAVLRSTLFRGQGAEPRAALAAHDAFAQPRRDLLVLPGEDGWGQPLTFATRHRRAPRAECAPARPRRFRGSCVCCLTPGGASISIVDDENANEKSYGLAWPLRVGPEGL